MAASRALRAPDGFEHTLTPARDVDAAAGRAGFPPADDLRRTCIHEYAHWAVARHFGAAGFVTIVACRGEPRYAGRFQMHGELADNAWRIVALAGAVAEYLAEDPAMAAAQVVAGLQGIPSRLSGVDAELAAGYAIADVEQCLVIVRAAWPEIDAAARERAADLAPDDPS